MNNKNSMTKLRNKIIRYFALITLITAVVESAIDSTYESWGSDHAPEPAGLSIDLPGIIYIAVSLLFYVIGGIVFYMAVKKAVREESTRQVNEQNFIYAAIAHDLRTPMTSVQGFAKALADGKIPPDEQSEICDMIYRKSKSMNELTELLFEYAKYGAEEYKPVLEKTDICVLMRDLAAENYCDFEEHGIELEIDIPDTPITVNADRKELRRALSNLTLNTCKHNPDGIKVLIKVVRENGKCVVTIADTGNAIPDGMNIFEPFVTENSARTTGGGSGLGLAITKRIIDRHKGTIALNNEPEGYTKAFSVTLDTE